GIWYCEQKTARVPYGTIQGEREEDYPNGTWLGDENNPEMRVRCPITPADMLHISTNCRTAEKMALTLLDYLFHREIQAISNLSGQGKHGKKQLDPLMIYGIRCHLFYKFGITESDWYRIKQSIDSKCRTAWRRKQRGQSLAVKSFSRRTPSSSSYSGSEGSQSTVSASNEIQQNQPQALHYALANAQQVQIHQIGEDGQVQVGHLHIAQVPQGEQVQITQDSEGNLQIHQVHVGQDGQISVKKELRTGGFLPILRAAEGSRTKVTVNRIPSRELQEARREFAAGEAAAAPPGAPGPRCPRPGALAAPGLAPRAGTGPSLGAGCCGAPKGSPDPAHLLWITHTQTGSLGAKQPEEKPDMGQLELRNR
ncbi:PREDICTED: protein BANP-like, partial [Tinamus guttatus]|uniref:protein BANP-like n=1 Tax=Tinamus guttatus TaxID=94827 RepID=UPI00052F1353